MASKLRPAYVTNGTGADFDKTAQELGYAPLRNPFKAGKANVVRRDRLETDRVDVEVEEIDHEH